MGSQAGMDFAGKGKNSTCFSTTKDPPCLGESNRNCLLFLRTSYTRPPPVLGQSRMVSGISANLSQVA